LENKNLQHAFISKFFTTLFFRLLSLIIMKKPVNSVLFHVEQPAFAKGCKLASRRTSSPDSKRFSMKIGFGKLFFKVFYGKAMIYLLKILP
jgi:hypothetical protein